MVTLDADVRRRSLDAAHILERLAPVRAAYVFGSHAEGSARFLSDIDVALFVDGIESWDMRRRAQAMAQIQKGAGLDVEAHLFSAALLDRAEEGSFAMYIVKHGIQLDLADLAA